MAAVALDVVALLAGVAAIVWGAETFAEHLAAASARLGVTSFALALLLAGAEPEELATAVAATVRDSPAIAFGDVIGANAAICLVALGVGAVVAPLPFGARVRRYALYVAYVAVIWIAERQPPALGEVGELDEARESTGRVGLELALVLAGLTAMVLGATLLVEGVRGLADADDSQARLSLTIVGFATAFELVVLAWAAARRGISDAVVAAVCGSFAYYATMTLGAAALVRPLRIADAGLI